MNTDLSSQLPSIKGQLIWDYFFKEFTVGNGYWRDGEGNYIRGKRMLSIEEAATAADEVASHYGASRFEGSWE